MYSRYTKRIDQRNQQRTNKMANGRRGGYTANQPTRDVCPCCGKKGLGVWDTNQDAGCRDRSCRYCGYTQFQKYVFNWSDRSQNGWVVNQDLETKYNENRQA